LAPSVFIIASIPQRDDPGLRVRDLYEVAGQAIRSVRWTTDPKTFIVAPPAARKSEEWKDFFAIFTDLNQIGGFA
jgi:hypothetical protein